VLGDDDRADEISDESVESYADRKNIDIIDNPRRLNASMANGETKQDLMDQIADLRSCEWEYQVTVAARAGIQNLRYLLLKAQRMAATRTEFVVFKNAA
jgi:hypothetical protein